ncbi:MAG TPA: hypothetical protein PKA28_05125 [Methylomusa anaerophila]|uniref:Uncharacterized protein n=1 Tax=Methylomusa anaerophila TaxID=1930071 RepID=A0A348AM76_9FIRM|nr:hypothetical protein [Methylomusa anaerophila]BBB92174.1 hypothetical protein MAMMFC1_02859 [Methylomusa anaerophila]HML87812.1 hypothetical protein [Methylomusa anaerophila]
MMNEKKHPEHPEFQLPDDPHAKHRYESAMKHVQFAKEAGKSSEKIHEIFRKVMNFDTKDIEKIPQDEAHKKYRSAVIHAQKAIENGKSSEEAHEIFANIVSGKTEGQCHHCK